MSPVKRRPDWCLWHEEVRRCSLRRCAVRYAKLAMGIVGKPSHVQSDFGPLLVNDCGTQ